MGYSEEALKVARRALEAARIASTPTEYDAALACASAAEIAAIVFEGFKLAQLAEQAAVEAKRVRSVNSAQKSAEIAISTLAKCLEMEEMVDIVVDAARQDPALPGNPGAILWVETAESIQVSVHGATRTMKLLAESAESCALQAVIDSN